MLWGGRFLRAGHLPPTPRDPGCTITSLPMKTKPMAGGQPLLKYAVLGLHLSGQLGECLGGSSVDFHHAVVDQVHVVLG